MRQGFPYEAGIEGGGIQFEYGSAQFALDWVSEAGLACFVVERIDDTGSSDYIVMEMIIPVSVLFIK